MRGAFWRHFAEVDVEGDTMRLRHLKSRHGEQRDLWLTFKSVYSALHAGSSAAGQVGPLAATGDRSGESIGIDIGAAGLVAAYRGGGR